MCIRQKNLALLHLLAAQPLLSEAEARRELGMSPSDKKTVNPVSTSPVPGETVASPKDECTVEQSKR